MHQLVVNADVMFSTAHGVRGDADELDEQLSALEREWQDISHGWSGSAAAAYGALWEKWFEGATKVVELVSESSGSLETAAAVYQQQDAESAQTVASSTAASERLAAEMRL